MGSKKKSDGGKGIYAVLIAAALAVMILVGALIAALVYVLNPFSEDDPGTQSTQQTVDETGNKNPFFSHEGSEGITVTYNGREVYAGGQVRPEDFTVMLNFKDGTSVEITEYESIIQTDTFRLIKGNNTIAFYYEGLWANAAVYAKDVSTLRYPPSYVINAVDEAKADQKISLIESGAISYQQALEKVAFTGDSQIKALTTNGILAEGQVLAKVGESLNYMEENLNKIIAMSYGKEVLVVHYGINSLRISEEGRAEDVERYKELLLTIKEALPELRIIVSGLFPVSDGIFFTQTRFAYIDDYNDALFAMCCEIGVDYLSDNEYIVSHQEYFLGDGLHLKKSFYTEYWLKNLIKTMGV